MQDAEHYIRQHGHQVEESALAAVQAAIDDAIADGDRRVAEAEAKAERYKTMIVTAILRSGRRQAFGFC